VVSRLSALCVRCPVPGRHSHNAKVAQVNVRSNPSLHLTFASRLRRLSPAGELKRYVHQRA
jgi:hypothetical protein